MGKRLVLSSFVGICHANERSLSASTMLNDLRFALRMIATHRWFSATVIVTLALSIGVNTTVFTLTNAALF
jgi:hypothetical protein